LVKDKYSPQKLTKDLMVIAKDFTSLLEILPRHLRWMLRKFSRNDFAIELKSPELRQVKTQLDINGRRISASIVVAGLAIASSIALQKPSSQMIGEYPLISVIFFGTAAIFLFMLIIRSWRK
jgi:hypothetical protein